MRRLLAPAAVAAALFAAGCGEENETEAPATVPQATATAEATPEADLEDTSTKPVIAKPEGDPPAELVKEDIVKGKGRAAKKGDTISVQYVGASFSTGEEFDASWDRGEPFSFQLGAGQVIPGWDQGLAGLKEGGRRRLVIPPDMAYGPAGSPPAIGPNETLIFIVDLEKIQP